MRRVERYVADFLTGRGYKSGTHYVGVASLVLGWIAVCVPGVYATAAHAGRHGEHDGAIVLIGWAISGAEVMVCGLVWLVVRGLVVGKRRLVFGLTALAGLAASTTVLWVTQDPMLSAFGYALAAGGVCLVGVFSKKVPYPRSYPGPQI